jgi:hypothetical protein
MDETLFQVQDDASSFLIAFLPATIEGEPQCLEHSELGWFTRQELSRMPLAPSDTRFVEFILSAP